jgi:hypothetical protein
MKLISLTIGQPIGAAPVVLHGAGGMPEGGPDMIAKIVGVGFELLILTAIILALLNLIWGGFNWIMSEGDKQRIGKARERIVYSIIGFLVVFLAFFIINLIYWFFFAGKISPYIFNLQQ